LFSLGKWVDTSPLVVNSSLEIVNTSLIISKTRVLIIYKFNFEELQIIYFSEFYRDRHLLYNYQSSTHYIILTPKTMYITPYGIYINKFEFINFTTIYYLPKPKPEFYIDYYLTLPKLQIIYYLPKPPIIYYLPKPTILLYLPEPPIKDYYHSILRSRGIIRAGR